MSKRFVFLFLIFFLKNCLAMLMKLSRIKREFSEIALKNFDFSSGVTRDNCLLILRKILVELRNVCKIFLNFFSSSPILLFILVQP